MTARSLGRVGLGIAGLAVVAAIALAAANRTGDAGGSTDLTVVLGEATRANARHDVEQERRLLLRAETLEGTPKDRAEVQRRLAAIDWKYFERHDDARARLLRAVESHAEPAKTWLALARLEQARAQWAAARDAARRAEATAAHGIERRDAELAFARAAVAEAAALRREHSSPDAGPERPGGAKDPADAPADDSGDTGETDDANGVAPALDRAFDLLHTAVTEEQGLLESSQLLLRAALLLDRGDAAHTAWRSYYRMTPDSAAPNAIAAAGAKLDALLPEWNGAPTDPETRVTLVEALAGARFFEDAALVARDPRAGEGFLDRPDVRAIVAYADAVREIRDDTIDYYRRLLHGDVDRAVLQTAVQSALANVLLAMGSPEGTRNALLAERFGAYINLGTTSGYYDLHMGHRVIDETRPVSQYGHDAELRFVALDHMVSNGFQSWAWESGAQHGGWAGPDTMWQVRPAYVNDAPEIWRGLHEPAVRKELLETMNRESALDDDRARDDPHAFLPGLAMRLKYQAILAIRDRLERRGLKGDALRLAFLAEFERTLQESSIFAHEGRHAIDRRMGTRLSGWKREYTAKLAEVVFTDDPRLALGSIFGPNIGDDTPHGRANLEVMKDIVKWMKKHREEIDGLDPERPLLPQFDLLTDEQIRDVFRSADPLAKKAG